MDITDIKITSFYKTYYGYKLRLVLVTSKFLYRETFLSEFDHLLTAKYLINNATSIKGKLKFYNQLKNNCNNYTSYKKKRSCNFNKK